MAKFKFILISGLFLFMNHTLAEDLERSIVRSLQDFAQSSVRGVKLSCAASRGPASINKSYMVSFQSGSGAKALLIQTERGKVQYVSLMREFVEFTRWKTFIPETGTFRVDAVGADKSVSELIFKSSKPNYVKAIESLAPKALDCCKSNSCRSRLE